MNNSGQLQWQVVNMLTDIVATMASGFVVCVTQDPVGTPWWRKEDMQSLRCPLSGEISDLACS